MERRNTIQKDLVLKAVVAMHRHVTADEVHDFIRSEHPSIGKGTVYRNLSILAEEHKIRRVEIPNGSDRFDYILHKHYHMRCVKCGEIFDVDMEELKEIDTFIHDKHGMIFLDHDILFKGVCLNCQQRKDIK